MMHRGWGELFFVLASSMWLGVFGGVGRGVGVVEGSMQICWFACGAGRPGVAWGFCIVSDGVIFICVIFILYKSHKHTSQTPHAMPGC